MQRGKSWTVQWYEKRDGKRRRVVKSFGPGEFGKQMAERLRKQVTCALALDLYRNGPELHRWEEFKAEYFEKVAYPKPLAEAEETIRIINRFERIVKPVYMERIGTREIEQYIAIRRQDPGRRSDRVSPATVNCDLRYIQAMLNKAYDWKVIDRVPKVPMLREVERVKTFVNQQEFEAIYSHCPDQWWRSFLLFMFLTGWRLNQTLQLRWSAVDLVEGEILGDAYDAKGRRDILLPLHDVLLDSLKRLKSFQKYPTEFVFAFKCSTDHLYTIFHNIQKEAGIKPRNKPNGWWYGFHDLRRGFATINAEHLDLFELQKLMQHKTLETTRKYVEMSQRLRPAVNKIQVPNLGEDNGKSE